jgi:hypothetical protein
MSGGKCDANKTSSTNVKALRRSGAPEKHQAPKPSLRALKRRGRLRSEVKIVFVGKRGLRAPHHTLLP